MNELLPVCMTTEQVSFALDPLPELDLLDDEENCRLWVKLFRASMRPENAKGSDIHDDLMSVRRDLTEILHSRHPYGRRLCTPSSLTRARSTRTRRGR